MKRAAPHVTGWPAEILGFGDRDMPDAAHGVSAGVATNAGADGTPSARSWGWIYGCRITPHCRVVQTA